MKLSLHCPSCSKPIANLHRTGEQVICPSCRNQYGVVYGKLSKRSSIYETLLYLTTKLPRFYKRHYTLQITTPDRTLKQLQFSIPGKVDQVPVHSGDLVSVLYTMRGYVMQKLVAITNHTTGKSYVLPTPLPSASNLTPAIATVMTGLLITAYLSGLSIFLTAVLGAIGMLMYLKVTNIAQLSSPSLEAQGREGTQLLADRRLIYQQSKIEQRIQDLHHDCKANQVLISQLDNLKQKMAALDPYLYSTRIFRATSAIKLIDQQTTNNRRLIREYQYALKMIEIEVETSWVADQLPDADDFARKILRKLEELKVIEEQNQFIKLQLAAYDELKQRF